MARGGWRIAARVLAATVGAYAVAAGFAASVGAVLAASAAFSRSDALIVGSMAAFALYTGLMLWCFGERRLGRLWVILLLATLALHGAAALIAPGLPVTKVPD